MKNNLEFKNIVEQYIIDSINLEYYNNNCITTKDKLIFVYEMFEFNTRQPECYKYKYSSKCLIVEFADWLKSKPPCFKIASDSYFVKELLFKWGILSNYSTEGHTQQYLNVTFYENIAFAFFEMLNINIDDSLGTNFKILKD